MRTIVPVIVCVLLLTTPTWAQNVDRCVPGDGLFFVRTILSITGMTIVEDGVPGEGARFVIRVPHLNWR